MGLSRLESVLVINYYGGGKSMSYANQSEEYLNIYDQDYILTRNMHFDKIIFRGSGKLILNGFRIYVREVIWQNKNSEGLYEF
jgi:hypothetical protein